MMTNPLPEILKLSVAERIQLVENIWDSIAAESDEVSLSDELRAELDGRLADQAANPGGGRSWSEVKARCAGSKTRMRQRALAARRERYEAALAEVPDVEPEEYDRL